MTATLKLLRELIALPSVNPAFLPPGDSRAGEHKISDYLACLAAKQGLGFELQPIFPGRSNVLVRLTPRHKPRCRIVLAPHLDTVVAHDYQFQPIIKNGRLSGRGACDTKGSVASMFQAMVHLSQSRTRPLETEIIFAGLVDEENVQAGSRGLVKSGFKADLAIVGEATRLKIVTAHKGSIWLKLETKGRSAHGARPELGDNAVYRMADVLKFLELDYFSLLRKRPHSLLGHPTVSVGIINGGHQPNIVPDKCSISVDRRTLPSETDPQVIAELDRLLKRRGLKVSISSQKQPSCLPLETNPELPLVKAFLKSAGQREPTGVNYFCDASVLSQGGIPSVVFGPGDIGHAHTAHEFISIESLERATRMLVRFLGQLP